MCIVTELSEKDMALKNKNNFTFFRVFNPDILKYTEKRKVRRERVKAVPFCLFVETSF